jgi:hypothetical protein
MKMKPYLHLLPKLRMQRVLLLWQKFQVLGLGITLVYPIKGIMYSVSKSLTACTTNVAIKCALPSSVFQTSEIYVTTIFQHQTSSHIYNLIKQYDTRVDTHLPGCTVSYIRK